MRRLIEPDAWKPRGIDELETAAEWSVRANTNIAVVAGPGAGKTELLAQRACFLLETGGCPPPKRILAISFKRDAASNLRERVQRRAGPELGRRFDSYTFDAFAKSILDQFLGAVPRTLRPTPDYDVRLGSPKAAAVGDVLARMRPPNGLGSASDLGAYESERFYKERVLRMPLHTPPASLEHWAAQEFWRQLLFSGERSQLYFGMINRLALGIVRVDARVRRAYRSAYSHVFLDEFQDTTEAQYDLTRLLFHGTSAILTAVGDPQQRIMGWAGALPNAFAAFIPDFSATEKRLERNRRASPKIAPVVRFLAARLREETGEAEAAEIAALEGGGPPPEACAAFIFDDDAKEAAWIAEEIAELQSDGVRPRDICILSRNRPALYTAAAVQALQALSIEARVEDSFQDLLSEPVVSLLLRALRALLTERPGTAWAEFRSELAYLQGLDGDDRAAALDHQLSQLRRALRLRVPVVPPGLDELRAVIASEIEPLFSRPLRNRFAQYQRGSFYEATITQFTTELVNAGSGVSWETAIARVEGESSIPIMSIHKSKGLEYAAVFFVGLEDGAFFSFNWSRPHAIEELNAFFVAISRAKLRVAFTFAKQRTLDGRTWQQSRADIGELYRLMEEAGVRIVDLTLGR